MHETPQIPPHPSSPPVMPETAPQVVLWYKVYLGFLCFLYFVVMAAGSLPLILDLSEEDLDGMPPMLVAILYVGIGGVFFIVSLIGFFLKRSPGPWVFHLVMICLGMTGCTIIFSIPLLIFWIKPETKMWFGRNP